MNSTKEGTKICHLTSAHESNDDRIDLKECFSLCKAGYRVFLVAKGNSRIDNGVEIVGVGNPPNHRLGRFLFFANRIYKKAFSLDCEIYHLHDPELLPYGVKLKHRGKKVIFDSHEDVPAQILDKEWIPAFLRVLISNIYKRYETHAVKQFDAVVAATPHIGEQFYGRAKKVVVINNYPRLDDIVFHDTPFSEREPIACYAGGISEQRGEKVMVQAMTGVEGTLIMAGAHPETDKTNQCKQLSNGGGVSYLGVVGRQKINDLYGRAVVGLVVLLPVKNYIESQPIKMYEYMAAGLPFIASDFPLWKEVVDQWRCGICVPPDDVNQTRIAIEKLFGNRRLAQSMGRNGRKAIEKKYNWQIEEKKLLLLYQGLEND